MRVPSGEGVAWAGSALGSVTGWGQGSAGSITARRPTSVERGWRAPDLIRSCSTDTIKWSLGSHTGLPASHRSREGPPVAGTIRTPPGPAYATAEPSEEKAGWVSSQNAAGGRSMVSRRVVPVAVSSVHTSEPMSCWSRMNTAIRPSGATTRWWGRGTAATASSRQWGGGGMSLRGWLGAIPPQESVPTHENVMPALWCDRPGDASPLASARDQTLEESSDEPSQGGEVVAAFLHRHGRESQ
jgi:hypothetical protein